MIAVFLNESVSLFVFNFFVSILILPLTVLVILVFYSIFWEWAIFKPCRLCILWWQDYYTVHWLLLLILGWVSVLCLWIKRLLLPSAFSKSQMFGCVILFCFLGLAFFEKGFQCVCLCVQDFLKMAISRVCL